MRILVVDDDETLRTELGALLRESGYEVHLARDGRETLEQLRRQEADVVILDMVLPGMTGLEVLREAHAAHPTTTFVVLTGHATAELAVEAMKAGASEFIAKPFDFDMLERSLHVMDQKLRARQDLAHRLEEALPPETTTSGSEVVAVLLTYVDGTLIGSRTRSGESLGDEDLLGATLNLIQDFMRTAFPVLRGEVLRTIVQGNYRLLIDAGEQTYLTIVVQGAESPGLYVRMRETQKAFEAANRDVLAQWNGMARQIIGLEELLSTFVPPAR